MTARKRNKMVLWISQKMLVPVAVEPVENSVDIVYNCVTK